MGNVCCSYLFDNQTTRLRTAIETSNEKQVIEILTKNPSIVNTECDKYGNTPIMFAIENAKVSMCKILLEHGADPNQENQQTHLTPLHLACSLRTLKSNLSMYNIHSSDLQTSIHENTQKTSLTQLNSNSPMINKTPSSSSSNASSNSNTTSALCVGSDDINEMMTLLVRHGGNINKVICAEKLNDNGLITTLPVSPLMFALDRRNLPALDVLIREGVDINYQEPTSYICALHLACGIGNVNLIIKLLENGANPFLKSKHNTSTLHWLALNQKDDTGGLLAIIRYTNNIIDLNIENENGQTALMLAAMKNKQNMVKTLLDNGASIDIKDKNGFNALDYAKDNSCFNLLASFNRIRKISMKKQSLTLSKMSLNNVTDSTNSSTQENYLNVSTMSLPNPSFSCDTLETVEEDFTKIVSDENRHNEKGLRL